MSEHDFTKHVLPTDSEERKNIPIFGGLLNYFPLACAAVARHSKGGNDKHNPGQPLHWSRDKSSDHAECIARHLIDHLTVNAETGLYEEATAMAWRSFALLEVLEEKRLGMPISRGSRATSAPAVDASLIRVVVGVLRKGKKVFLQRRSLVDENFPGAWECPGGAVEPGEDHHGALRRELTEELGIRATEIDALPLWVGTFSGYKGRRHEFVFYEVLSWEGALVACDDQPEMSFHPLHRPPLGMTPANLLAWPALVSGPVPHLLGMVRR